MVSDRAKNIAPSATLSVDAKAKAMKKEGIDIIGFGAGEPDFDTPQHIKDAAIEALNGGFTKYVPAQGIPELCSAISEKLKNENNIEEKKPDKDEKSNNGKGNKPDKDEKSNNGKGKGKNK